MSMGGGATPWVLATPWSLAILWGPIPSLPHRLPHPGARSRPASWGLCFGRSAYVEGRRQAPHRPSSPIACERPSPAARPPMCRPSTRPTRPPAPAPRMRPPKRAARPPMRALRPLVRRAQPKSGWPGVVGLERSPARPGEVLLLCGARRGLRAPLGAGTAEAVRGHLRLRASASEGAGRWALRASGVLPRSVGASSGAPPAARPRAGRLQRRRVWRDLRAASALCRVPCLEAPSALSSLLLGRRWPRHRASDVAAGGDAPLVRYPARRPSGRPGPRATPPPF